MKELLKKYGLNMKEASDLLHIPYRTIQNVIDGISTWYTLRRCAKIFRVLRHGTCTKNCTRKKILTADTKSRDAT